MAPAAHSLGEILHYVDRLTNAQYCERTLSCAVDKDSKWKGGVMYVNYYYYYSHKEDREMAVDNHRGNRQQTSLQRQPSCLHTLNVACKTTQKSTSCDWGN